jgi:uncharacterized membrane protein YphA (DoxX/SURF4 family)
LRILGLPQPLALLVMRLALGAIMIAAGSHKVFGGLHRQVHDLAVAIWEVPQQHSVRNP